MYLPEFTNYFIQTKTYKTSHGEREDGRITVKFQSGSITETVDEFYHFLLATGFHPASVASAFADKAEELNPEEDEDE